MSLLIDIEKRLGSFHLQVQLQAQDEVTALSGASGCGKSMTLKCIAGIVTPDRGRIVLNDRVLFDSAAHIDLPPQRRRVGYLFQNYALFPTMTVEKNILCAIPGSKTEKGAALSDAVRRFRLEGLEQHYSAQLSGGQQQRVALARILCAKPEAILLDEPFSALDSYLKWQLELELSDLLAAFRGPILWVSHDRGEVFRSCRQICVLDHGHSQGTLTPEQLLHRPGTESAARLSGCENIVEAHPAQGRRAAAPVGADAPLRPCRAAGLRQNRNPGASDHAGAAGDPRCVPLPRGADNSGRLHRHGTPCPGGLPRPCRLPADGAAPEPFGEIAGVSAPLGRRAARGYSAFAISLKNYRRDMIREGRISGPPGSYPVYLL